LIAGERRWRAAAIAERETVPAIIRERDTATALEIALVENMAREDLNAVDEARACAALVEELGLTREEVGLRVGRSRVAVSNLLRLLDLPDEALELIERHELTEGHGRALLLAEDHADRRGLARQAATSGWSVRELEARARSVGGEVAQRKRRARSRPELHPDQAAAIEQISDALGQAIGADVEVTAAGRGYRAHLAFESLDEALELARRLGIRAVRDPPER
jgi:ParB family chromosome partitioning protein